MADYLLWLLLPVAAASGWLAARASYKKRRISNTVSESPQQGYFKGLNYILNEQPDKAIEVFVEMVQVDSETVETHLALGNLFRKRGEVDRAIRIHQNLIARPTLNVEQRAHALAELGQDYMSAGLLDRAENIFSELVDNALYKSLALGFLRDIYQSEQEWENAIKVTRSMTKLSRTERNKVIAQYYCELAEQAKEKNDTPLVKRYLKQAASTDSECARASFLQGEVEWSANNIKNALRFYQRFMAQAPHLSDEVIEHIYDCHHKLGSMDQFAKELGASSSVSAGPLTRKIEFELSQKAQGEDGQINAIFSLLERHPSLSLASDWLELLGKRDTPISDVELNRLMTVLSEMADESEGYRCQHCGYLAKSLHWLCPSCKHWDSARPVSTVLA